MVERNLKAGDTFLDGGLPYIVLKVLPNGNYISRLNIQDDAKAATEKPVKKARKAPTKKTAARKTTTKKAAEEKAETTEKKTAAKKTAVKKESVKKETTKKGRAKSEKKDAAE